MGLRAHGRDGAARLAAAGALLAIALAVVLAACGGDDDETPATTDTVPTATAQTEGEATTPETETGSGTGETETDAGTETEAVPEGPPFANEPASGSGSGGGTPLLADVRLARHPGYDRIVFEFRAGGLPGYDVDWISPPITTDPGGATMSVGGEAFLSIRMEPASGFDLSGDAGQTYRGPLRLSGAGAGTEIVVDLVRTGDFEAVLTWVAGLERETPFRVFTLSGPPRLVVDVRTGE